MRKKHEQQNTWSNLRGEGKKENVFACERGETGKASTFGPSEARPWGGASAERAEEGRTGRFWHLLTKHAHSFLP